MEAEQITKETTRIHPFESFDYSLTGVNSKRAIELGLAEAEWYQSPVEANTLRKLMKRKDGPAIRDTLLLIAILGTTGTATVFLWGTWWAVIPYLIYAVFYGTSSDSRWHECGHGTAFRTDWMNDMVYEVASFMVMRESVIWRWSHTRHHSDTIIVGRDPEIQVPRPPSIRGLILSVFNYGVYKAYYPSLFRHALGKVTDAEKSFVPETEFRKIYRNARIYLSVYALVIISAIVLQSWIPIFLIILPNIFGTWLMIVHNTTQHAGLAENVLDHRLNCRTVYMNPISRFIYWNMNYHLEHHMYPLVPYHALPKLHVLVREDCPPVYPTILSAWKEILPTLRKQVKDPTYHVKREIPKTKSQDKQEGIRSEVKPDDKGWIEVCDSSRIANEDILRFDHGKNTYVICRDRNGTPYVMDGICTHGYTHLAKGLVKDDFIECPKHNGRFHLADGSPARNPIGIGLSTYPVEDRKGKIRINIENPGGDGSRSEKNFRMRVVSNNNISTFIKELILEPLDSDEKIDFIPGDYLQIDIPEYDRISFKDLQIAGPYHAVWERMGLFELTSSNKDPGRRNNYSIASNPRQEVKLRFNVRISLPPSEGDYPPGIGSSYVFNLKPGDMVTASGPYGDFHIKPTLKEMVYIGGGSGMAPIRSHIAHLFENESTNRKVSYWYGARSRMDIFYDKYFENIAEKYPNFSFSLALSEPLEEDKWTGYTGFIHTAAYENYLKNHKNPQGIEYYLCGPPAMISACKNMLEKLGVKDKQIAFDEF
jgi:Na+-transporting NADH:ubiquinone oxidoreductase subunit F